MPPRLHIITLGVHDFERALRFYRDGLGWTPSAAGQTSTFSPSRTEKW